MYDCIIVGSGAAGVSAALTLKALKKNFIIIGSARLSAKIRTAEKIRNYPGMPTVSGKEMAEVFSSQLNAEGIEITEGKVNGVYPVEGGYAVSYNGEIAEGRTVILCTGVETVKPFKGETEFLGRGVSYCAVCDGFLYKGKTIAVFLENKEDMHEVELLADYAERVYLFTQRGGACPKADNISVVDGRISEIEGDMRVRKVSFGGGEIAVDGVFVLKSSAAAHSIVHGIDTENGAVTVTRKGETNLAGVFAAGDVTGRPYQYAKAVGEGNVCAYSVNEYLNSLK